jgi:hypothetical protein
LFINIANNLEYIIADLIVFVPGKLYAYIHSELPSKPIVIIAFWVSNPALPLDPLEETIKAKSTPIKFINV